MSATCERFDREGVARLVGGAPEGGSDDLEEHERGCAACQEARARYLAIIDALGALPVERAPAGWQERVMASLPAESSRPALGRNWPLWTALAIAAAVLLWRVVKPEPPSGRLAVRQDVVAAAAGRRSDTATIGDTVRVAVTGGEGDVREARLYRDTGELVARCPGHASCTVNGTTLELTVTLTSAGSYRTLAIVGPKAVPEPTGSLDEDAKLAAAAGATVELSRAIEVE